MSVCFCTCSCLVGVTVTCIKFSMMCWWVMGCIAQWLRTFRWICLRFTIGLCPIGPFYDFVFMYAKLFPLLADFKHHSIDNITKIFITIAIRMLLKWLLRFLHLSVMTYLFYTSCLWGHLRDGGGQVAPPLSQFKFQNEMVKNNKMEIWKPFKKF